MHHGLHSTQGGRYQAAKQVTNKISAAIGETFFILPYFFMENQNCKLPDKAAGHTKKANPTTHPLPTNPLLFSQGPWMLHQ